MTEKRRLPHGERQHAHKLTDYQVVAIRKMWRLGLNGGELARLFGVSDTTVYRIVHRQSRKTPTVWHEDLRHRRQS